MTQQATHPDRPADKAAARLPALRGLWPFLRPYRWQLGLAALFLLLAAASTLVLPWALKGLIDQGFIGDTPEAKLAALRGHFGLLFGLAVVLGLTSAARFYMVSWLGERVTADVRKAVYAHVIQQSPAFFETTRTGEVLSRLTTDTTLVQTVVGSSFSMGLRNAVMGVGAMAMLVITNPYVMGQVLLILALIVAPAIIVSRRVRKLSRSSQDRVADSSAIAAEVLNAVPQVQSYAQEAREAKRFADAAEAAVQTANRRNITRSSLTAFIICGVFGALLWGLFQGTQAVLAGRISAGHLGQTVVYVGLLAGSVGILAEAWGDLLRAAGATERLMELLNARSPVQDPASPQRFAPAPQGSRVALREVSFCYPSRPAQPSLRGVSLHIEAGETVALVGPSGAGKTTLFQLLLRLYDVQQGVVSLDGVDVRQVSLRDLRERVAFVSQDAVIFSSSVADNIRYGRPDASDAEVQAAAEAAYAHGFICDLPDGYQTYVGERGVRLSGGQRQRLSIARAMLKNAPLLLLDEATSALDAESERAVQAALDAAMAGRTTLVIAHRLATVQNASRIVVLEQGQVVAVGSHAELVAQGGLYARLAALQFAAPA